LLGENGKLLGNSAVGDFVSVISVYFWGRGRRQQGDSKPEETGKLQPQASSPGSVVPVKLPERWDLPPELAGFRRVEVFELSDADHDALLARLTHIPRPPNGLHKLLSPQFLEGATAAELSELILAEPAVAAKVLATVNSPFYGLPRPVTSVEQAVAVLGMDAVRGICLRHMVSESMRPATPVCSRFLTSGGMPVPWPVSWPCVWGSAWVCQTREPW